MLEFDGSFMSYLSIENLYPLLSRVKELSHCGDWYTMKHSEGEVYPTIAPWKVKKLTVDSIMLPLPSYCSAVKTLSFRLGLICYCDSWDDKGVSGPEGQRLLAQLRGMPSLKTIILFVTEFTHMDEYSPDRLIYSEFNTQGVVDPNSVRDRKSDSKQAKWTLEEILNLI